MTQPPPSAESVPAHRVRVRAKFFFEGAAKFFLKGVTYGPFAPDADGDHFGAPEAARRDLGLIRELGGNLLRVYYVPPRWFLDLCSTAGLRVLISIPWAEHIDFLDKSRVRQEVEEMVRKAVRTHKGHPAIFGYLVGNEIPSSMVRWLGPARVTEFVERLVAIGRDEDPEVLYSYASYPPTEYLLPQNVDFYTFNVYLHRQEDFDRYLARLQNLAGERPLVMGEFGMDTIRHPEQEQAGMLSWHIESVVRGGLAGTILYAWTDEWFRGGMEITDWAFGLVRRDRTLKPAFEAVRRYFGPEEPVTRRVGLPQTPRVSVIVCSYNGGKTLRDCLEALGGVDYPDFEIVLVDDGSKDNTQEIVRDWQARREERRVKGATLPDVVSVRQENMGLSHARNAGARAATGAIYAYTDSDCMADPDWLYYLVGTLLSGEYVGVGGPNISPPAVNWVQASVAAAPGGPSHVLLTDVIAEHIPGCNMAFHAAAFWSVGGFDTEYRKAGDDVDFCWRLQTNGGVIAFSPAAIVWHYRRFTLTAFRKQQEGYGEAESLLRFKHLVFFGPTGTAKWKGQIYGGTRFSWVGNRPIIYHGVFGSGLFQSIYPAPQSEVAAYLSSLEWVALSLFLFLLSIPFKALAIVPYLMLGGTFLVALSYMMNARIEPGFDTVRARLLTMFLALTQPLVRGWARYYTWLKFKRTPASVIAAPEEGYRPVPGGSRRIEYWNEAGKGREELLTEVSAALEREGWRYSIDTGWKPWDLQIYGSFWWVVKLRSVTEYHGGPKCLTRVLLSNRPVVTLLLVNLIILPILLWRQFFVSVDDLWLWVPYVFLLVWLTLRARRLRKRVAQLVEAAARRCGLDRMVDGRAPSR